MSFSSDIKDELCRVETRRGCCERAEFAAAYFINIMNGSPPDCFITENAAFARRIYSFARKLLKASPDVSINRNKKLKKNMSYVVRVNAPVILNNLANGGKSAAPGTAAFAVTVTGTATATSAAPEKTVSAVTEKAARPDIGSALPLMNALTKKKCCKKAALRGAFLAGGSISDPEKLYHLEIYCKNHELAALFAKIMADFNLNSKLTERSEYYVAYIKDSEQIVNFLNLTGAHRALMALENTRILKDVRNSVNRAVNCETANLEKTVNASMRQIANISYIKAAIGFDALPKNLREIAAVREANKEISLKELGQILNPPLGKSGVNHRLHRLDVLADELRRKRIEESR